MLRFTTSVLDPVEYAIHSIMEIIFNHFKKKDYFSMRLFSLLKWGLEMLCSDFIAALELLR